jgi:hypothetical protein
MAQSQLSTRGIPLKRILFTILALLFRAETCLAAFVIFGVASTAGSDPTSNVLPNYDDVYANWTVAGALTVPTRSTQCGSTINPSLVTPPATGDDADNIAVAIAACSAGDFVQLGSGTFVLDTSEYILLNKGVSIRGTGTCGGSSSPYCATVLTYRNGTVPYYATDAAHNCGTGSGPFTFASCGTLPMIYIAPEGQNEQRWGGANCNNSSSATGCTNSVALTADAAQGDTLIHVASTSGFSVGQWIRIDEASGAVTQSNPANNPSSTMFAAPDAVNTSGSPATGKIVYAGASVEYGGLYGALYDRETSELKKISAIGSGTITFDSPLTIAFRSSGNYHAQIYAPFDASGVAEPFLTGAGVENLSITRADYGSIYMSFCAGCWIKNVEAANWIYGVALDNVARSVVTGSFFHDCMVCANSGQEYPFAIDGASTENLIDNNIFLFGGKGMVGRACGGGNVVSYNYVDKQFYMASNGNPANWWSDSGVNGAHYTGCHHVLFEGNWGSNCNNDTVNHGNVVYLVYFRNDCTGLRTNFNDPSLALSTSSTYNAADAPVSDASGISYAPGNPYPYAGGPGPLSAAGAQQWGYWFGWVGNVLGEASQTTSGNGWTYAAYNQNTGKIMWLLGWGNGSSSDPNLNGTNGFFLFRHGNYDYYDVSIVDWATGYSHTLPNSFYVSAQPSFFGSSGANCIYPWPWVTPTAGSPLQTPTGTGCISTDGLPAKARYDAGTPFVQP